MYRLTVVAGPNRGASYLLREGENIIGRRDDNQIVLSSNKVSKSHCTIHVNAGQIDFEDLGSSNGTFLNGVLTKRGRLSAGDRLGVGDFVLQLMGNVKQQRQEQSVAMAAGAELMSFPSVVGPDVSTDTPHVEEAPIAMDLPSRVKGIFDRIFLPFFYQMNLKTEWRFISLGVLVAAGILIILFSLVPLTSGYRQAVVRTSLEQAWVMAKGVAESNAEAIAKGQNSQVHMGFVEKAPDVYQAVVVDLDNRIIAPAQRLNQFFSSGPVAQLVVKAARLYRDGATKPVKQEVSENLVVSIEPIQVYQPRLGRNMVVALSVVSLDISRRTMGAGDLGLLYSQTLIFALIILACSAWILYRLVLKRFEVLNEDIDKVLQGELPQITNTFKHEEFNSLFEVIAGALQRVPKGGEGDFSMSEQGFRVEDAMSVFESVSEVSGLSVLVCDDSKRVVYMNSAFEDLTGVRLMDAQGSEFSSVARDQATAMLFQELMTQLQMGGSARETAEFSGSSYEVHASALGSTAVKGYVFILNHGGNEEI